MKNFLKIINKAFFVIIVLIAFVNCENESVDLNNQDASVRNAKAWFVKNKQSLRVLEYAKTIDWNKAIVTDGVKGKVVEVPIFLKDKDVVNINYDKSLKCYNRLMFILDEKKVYNVYHVIISHKKDTFDVDDEEVNFYKIKEDFEGLITVIDSKNIINDVVNLANKKTNRYLITNKTKTDGVVCVYYGYWDENDEFHAYYQVGCYGGGSGSSGGTSYGSGGGKSESQPDDKTVCYNSLEDLISGSYAVSDLVTSSMLPQTSNSRIKNYRWTIFKGPGYKIISSDSGLQKKISTNVSSLQWEWNNLTHNSIDLEGFVAGGNITFNLVYAQPTIGKYNSIMNINYNVKFSLVCSGSPVSSSGNYNSSKIFNVND
nr:hypothetical protein [uncultured Flavobacterium sp.]